MKKREFLKSASLFAAGAAFPQLMSCNNANENTTSNETMGEAIKVGRTNWAGNYTYNTDNLVAPHSVEELQEMIKSYDKAKGLGTMHCFNGIADSKFNQISTAAFNKVIGLDKEKHTVTVQSGIKYGEFCEYLDENGFALHNLASLPHISVAGACSTSTHGSGIKNGGLATAVTALEMVNGKGELVKLSKEKDGDEFRMAVIGLGALGIVTQVTLKVVPTFKMKQIVYQNMPMAALEKDFEKIMGSGYSVSLFTDWKNKNVSEVWIKSKSEDMKEIPKEFFGATLATKNLHPIESADAINCTDQMGEEGPWYKRMPHFKMGFTPSSGKELQSEFFVDIKHAYEAFMAVEKLNEKVAPLLFITEIRTIAADDLPMSPFYKKTCLAIHFTWKQEIDAVNALLPEVEKALDPFSPRPHWGKVFRMEPKTLQSRISRLDEFKALMAKHDPDGKFRNDYINTNLFG
ncbi:FAD-binding protein [Lacihabitans sp. LS3-19]|uniref:D-arabinono-1,4-lactone oxidase n=1 Tax=Lacihabitans sp. LS3-19 TaxID=2487335 RepID=UPI0020CE4AE6|nr:D-arabinono-1,4-lactone oxidase [Lacihabitans sp. LS3-19]MCP9769197.1 FAD-binding protein [Lacihabitans sp. LS3-19]